MHNTWSGASATAATQGPLLARWEDAPGTASTAGLAPLCAAPGTYVHDH